MKYALTIILLLLLLPSHTRAETYHVKYTNTGFLPKEVIISVGDTVRVTNNSTNTLTVGSSASSTHPSSQSHNIGLIEEGTGIGVMTFNAIGEHIFENKDNPAHTGKIIVVESTPPTPTPEGLMATSTSPLPTPKSLDTVIAELNQKVLGIKETRNQQTERQIYKVLAAVALLGLGTIAMIALYVFTKVKPVKRKKKITPMPNPKKIFSTPPTKEDRSLSSAQKDIENWLKKAL